MSLLAAVLALLIGVALGLLGGGGSILTVPLFVYVLGVPDKSAVASSLLVVGATSAVAAIPYARGGLVRWKVALIFASSAMASAIGGGLLARSIPGAVLLSLFALLMVITSGFMWKGRATGSSTEAAGELKTLQILGVGLGVGFVTGLVGAGGGFLVVPALALLGGLPMRSAVGTSLVVIAMNSTAGFLGYVSHVEVSYALAASVVSIAIVGSWVGSRLARRVPAQHLRKAFSVFVMAMGIFILWREVGRI